MSCLKVIAILGATATGKSELAIEVANRLGNSIIVNCDSRQVYKHMDIGTAKVEGAWVSTREEAWKRYGPLGENIYVYKNIVHCLIDYKEPGETYSLVEYLRDWYALIDTISTMKQPPEYILLVGGTGYFAQAIIEKIDPSSYSSTERYSHSNNTPTYVLRARYYELVLHSGGRLLNASDFYNRARLLNYTSTPLYPRSDNRFVIHRVFSLMLEKGLLKERIALRTETRLGNGLFTEFTTLQKKYPHIDLGRYALEYAVLQQEYLGWIHSSEVARQINQSTLSYAKKQNTWLAKMHAITIANLQEMLDYL